MTEPHFVAIDVGSPAKGNMGWWVLGPSIDRGGTNPDELIKTLVEVVRSGPVVLGFEAPMYVPAKRQSAELLRMRPGEGSRAWSVAAGATTIAIALAIVPWLLDELARHVDGVEGWQDWQRLPNAPRQLLVYEAFVSGGPSDGHAEDARAAAVATRELFAADSAPVSALNTEPCFSVLGAALLHAGMSTDLSELDRQCIVVRAAKNLSGDTRG